MNYSDKKRGRPKKASIDTAEITLAKKYHAYVNLGEELTQGIKAHYPRLTNENKINLKHLIFAAAEEHRLWADLDNLLLSIQRHKAPLDQLTRIQGELHSSFAQLQSIYTLILKPMNIDAAVKNRSLLLESETSIANNLDWLASIETNKTDISNWVKHQLHNITTKAQATWLMATSDALKAAITDLPVDSNLNIDTIKSIRFIIRSILLSVATYKIEPLYKSKAHTGVGRPALPLPTQLLRAEDALLNASRSYRLNCQQLHRKSLSIQQVWEKHKPLLASATLGRKTMPMLQVLINKRLKIDTDLYCLTLDKEQISEKIKLENENKRGTKGRPALTYDQRVRKIEHQLNEIDDLIKLQKMELSTSIKNGRAFKQQTLEYQRIWLENKLKRHLHKNEQARTKSSNACLHYWSTTLERVTNSVKSSK